MRLDQCIDSYMAYCHSRKLPPKTMNRYEQALRLFEKWLSVNEWSDEVKDIKDRIIQEYIINLEERGKYTVYVNPSTSSKHYNCPERRRDYQNPVSNIMINNYLRACFKSNNE